MIRQDQSSWSNNRTMCHCLVSSHDSASVSAIDKAIIRPGHVSAESFALTDMLSIT